MAFKYDEAVPWGRSFDEYQRMFALSHSDLRANILGCADGPASFNAVMAMRNIRMVSCDPLYQFCAKQIEKRIDATYETVIGQTRQNQDKFVWDLIASPDELGRVRMNAMRDFLSDYDAGRKAGRYVPAELPDLPFPDSAFDIALCSHFLFFYADSLSIDFHAKAIDELCRVAREVRLFPLLTYNAEPCAFVTEIAKRMEKRSRVSIEKVPYEFQRSGNLMMRIIR